MSRRIAVVMIVLVALVFHAVRPRPARASDTETIAIAVSVGTVALVALVYLGTMAAYPEKIHMLAPGDPDLAKNPSTAGGLHFGAQCPQAGTPQSPNGAPLVCW